MVGWQGDSVHGLRRPGGGLLRRDPDGHSATPRARTTVGGSKGAGANLLTKVRFNAVVRGDREEKE